MKDLRKTGRRAFLRGLGGATLALPLLEYTHRDAGAAGEPADYFVTFFAHGGVISNQAANGYRSGNGKESGVNLWAPAAPGEDLVLGTHHAPLQEHVDSLLVLQGLDNYATREQAKYGTGGHYLNNALALTVSNSQIGSDDKSRAGNRSIDFEVADLLQARHNATFDRVHLYVRAHNYGSPYYSAAGQRVGGEKDPLVAFNTIFAGVTGDDGPTPEQLREFAMRRSVVDGVLASYKDARKVVGARDRATIDAHLEHLYELESQLNQPTVQCTPPADIVDADGNGRVIAELHAKIILAALRCGLTHVANLEMGDIITPWTPTGHPIAEANLGHSLHKLQRSVGPQGADANRFDTWLAEVTDNHLWRMSIFKMIVDGLADPAFAHGGKTMLDRAVMLYTSEFSEGANHCGSNIPVLLAGRAGGQWKTGRHLDFRDDPNDPSSYATEWSTHNLFNSMLEAFGGAGMSFGNGDAPHSGTLPNLAV